MNRIFFLFMAVLGLLSPTAAGQGSKASGKLYSRTVGDDVQVAIVIEIAKGFHLYHWELGGENATGKPLVVTLGGKGVEFEDERQALVWPEPHNYPQEDFVNEGQMTYILGHEKKLVIFGHGKANGSGPPAVSVELDGLTCEDDGSCYPYNESLNSLGEGPSAVWRDYPTDAWTVEESALAEKPFANTGSFGSGGFGFPSATGTQEDGSKAHGKLITHRDGDQLELGILIEIAEGFHLYHWELGGENATGKPLTVKLTGAGIHLDHFAWPEPHSYPQEDFVNEGEMTFILGHEKLLMLYGVASLDAGASVDGLRVELSGLACEDSGLCVPYDEVLSSTGEGDEEIWSALRALDVPSDADASPTETPPSDPEDEDSDKDEEGLMALILAAIGGGIFALLMPCTYPMIPITISFFTKQAEARGGKVWPLSLTYGVGIVLIFILIGVVVGPVILVWATHPVTNMVLGLMFVVFAAALFGAITLNPPAFMMNMAGKASMKGGLFGVFLMGTTLVLTSFTCTAPFVGTLLSIAASGGDDGGNMGRIVIGMGVFGLTMAVPFTVLSMLPGKVQSMPGSGEWMDTLKVSLGFVELAAAMKFFSNADLVWGWEMLSRELFLLLWAVIFIVGGIYLLGWIHVKGHSSAEIGSGRMLGALGFLLFGAYCLHGYNGHTMDNTMTAIIPPYSSAPVSAYTATGHGDALPKGRALVVDDHARAKQLAIAEGKPLLINFTGVT